MGGSFIQLVRQAELEALIQQVLVNRTVTFQRVELISSDVNWVQPSEARLNDLLIGTLTPNQVWLLEDFVARETGQRFTLIFVVSQIEEIRGGNDEQSPTATE